MNNERLEFRAWHKGIESMASWDRFFDEFMWHFIPEVGPGVTEFQSLGEAIIDNNIEVMQWTGHYDFDGQEIYEGDLIDAQWDSDEPEIMVVEWLGQGFEPSDFPLCESKVVGNVYQNPELLD